MKWSIGFAAQAGFAIFGGAGRTGGLKGHWPRWKLGLVADGEEIAMAVHASRSVQVAQNAREKRTFIAERLSIQRMEWPVHHSKWPYPRLTFGPRLRR